MNILTVENIKNISIDKLLFKHHERVLQINFYSPECFWDNEDLLKTLSEKSVFGFIVKENTSGNIIGFVIFKFTHFIEMLNLVIHPDYQRRGVGTFVLDFLKQNYEQSTGGCVIEYKLQERNLTGHLFLKSNCFKSNREYRFCFDSSF